MVVKNNKLYMGVANKIAYKKREMIRMFNKIFGKDRSTRDQEALSLIHGVPDGFFRCSECKKVFPTTKLGEPVWGGKSLQQKCKNCLSVGEAKPVIPQRLQAAPGELPRNVKRY